MRTCKASHISGAVCTRKQVRPKHGAALADGHIHRDARGFLSFRAQIVCNCISHRFEHDVVISKEKKKERTPGNDESNSGIRPACYEERGEVADVLVVRDT